MFIKNFIFDLTKIDTILAFIVSFVLYIVFTNNPKNALVFSILFVLVFLLILNIVRFMM